MEAELATLVTSGATTVVGLMVTDAWQQARQGLVRLFSRGDRASAVGGELDELRDELVAAAGSPDEATLADDIAATVRLRLRGLLRQDAAAAGELRLLVEELAPLLDNGAGGNTVHNTINGGTMYAPVIMGYSVSNPMFNGSDGAAPDRDG
ncbi:hypothetical protein [Streptomyces sp. NRRL F-2799]|uniref:hypothetical protein n=1 Tax=Streptomyces sp. NRRL F-2799 TaxID=1463844 RepID=UPI0004CA2621|nr:hypothetical protein [Streptomyces sp. NRRL F-2799]